jgi:hypothetical protein
LAFVRLLLRVLIKCWMFIHSFDKMLDVHSFLWQNGGCSFIPLMKWWGGSFIPFITTMMGLFPNYVKPWDGTIYPYMMIYIHESFAWSKYSCPLDDGYWNLHQHPCWVPSGYTSLQLAEVKFSTTWPCLMPWRNSTHKPSPPPHTRIL